MIDDPFQRKQHSFLCPRCGHTKLRRDGRCKRCVFREHNAIASRKWRTANKAKHAANTTAWRKANPERHAANQKRVRDRIRATVRGKIDHRMEVMVRKSLGVVKNGRKWTELLGYTPSDLRDHLRSKFTEGMTWEAFCRGEIEIDHIRPKTWFEYSSPTDSAFLECWALSNLRPLWSRDNKVKGNRFSG